MKKFLLIVTALAAFTACKQEEQKAVLSYNSAALATPYVHNGDTSIFHIKDYTLEEEIIK